jgi:hypothetical protein
MVAAAMSNKVHHCAKCNVDAVCDSVRPFAQEEESAFAVAWKCPRCEECSLIVSPLGPWLAPGPGMCLQCGREGTADGEACPICGIIITEVLSAEDAGRPDGDLLLQAREDFARGTCRRGLTLVNHVLRRNPRSEEAWSIKGQFFEHLGFRRALKAAMQEAVRLKGAGGAIPDQARTRRWWEFWK